ncbi:MAG: lipopolysaccharide biosynthesis protein [Lachnospiraceae bacterium]|jgi:O-antigen/teichoic acid export membrane protein|nr:lipopolysaccharide biosynthesis protein [Lachnospiraceae bacterium]
MRLRRFLLWNKNITRNATIWNFAGNVILSCQSVLMLMILTRTAGLAASGIFTIAYADANLFLNIGKFGMRTYQVSDVDRRFSFRDYIASRRVTTVLMMAVALIYVFWASFANDYPAEKTSIIIWMLIFKAPDAIEDVFYGEYQRRNRLDVAARCMTVRLAVTTLVFGLAIFLTRDLLQSLICSSAVTYVLLFLLLFITAAPFSAQSRQKSGTGNYNTLLKECFPLFAGAFLSLYICFAPRYAIDATLSDDLQAYYGFISMPTFVIGLLNSAVYSPFLYRLSCQWNDGRIARFRKHILMQVGCAAAITAVCMAGAWFIGVPVLSWIYASDISRYRREMMILLLGGGFLGISDFLCAVLVIMRRMSAVLTGYTLVAVPALLCTNVIVRKFGLTGASYTYLVLMAAVCLCFTVTLLWGMEERMRSGTAAGRRRG